jgi:TetR/AcrR family transcriptional repressor of lmrAB and yxaGH operons
MLSRPRDTVTRMPSSDSRDRMLRSAAELFGRHGYQATSWRQIVDHGGAPWGSINFLFPKGKDQLAVEALALSGREFDGRLRQAFFEPPVVRRSLVSLVATRAANLRASQYELSNPIATVALEMAHRSPTVRAACVEVYQTWCSTLVELLSPQLGDESAAELAGLFLSVYDGAILRARTLRDTSPLDELVGMVPRLVKLSGE